MKNRPGIAHGRFRGSIEPRPIRNNLRIGLPATLPVFLEFFDQFADFGLPPEKAVGPGLVVGCLFDSGLESPRCKVSSVRDQPKDFSQLTQPPTTLSMYNVISFLQGRTRAFRASAMNMCARQSRSFENVQCVEFWCSSFNNVTTPYSPPPLSGQGQPDGPTNRWQGGGSQGQIHPYTTPSLCAAGTRVDNRPSCGPQRCENLVDCRSGAECANCRKGTGHMRRCHRGSHKAVIAAPCGRRSSCNGRQDIPWWAGSSSESARRHEVDHQGHVVRKRRRGGSSPHSSMGSQARAGSIAIIICGGISPIMRRRPIVSMN